MPIWNLDAPQLVDTYDELPLWSAPFGLELLEWIDMRPNMQVLDVGCGPGFPLLEMAQRLGKSARLYGLDPWKGAHQRVQLKLKQYGMENVEMMEGVAEKMPFQNDQFHLITSNNGLNNVADLDQSLQECQRVLRPGGQLVFTFNLPDSFRLLYDQLSRCMKEHDIKDVERKIRDHIYQRRRSLSNMRKTFEEAGLKVTRWKQSSFSWRFLDGTTLLQAYFVQLGLGASWLELAESEEVMICLEKCLNSWAEQSGELRLIIPFAVIEARK